MPKGEKDQEWLESAVNAHKELAHVWENFREDMSATQRKTGLSEVDVQWTREILS